MDDKYKSALRLFSVHRYRKALDEFLKTGINPSTDVDLSYYIGLCYTRLGEYEDALEYLEQVVTMGTNLFYVCQCRLILSYIYSITGRYKLAEFELSEMIKNGYESTQLYSIMGYSLYAQKKTDESMDFFKKAEKLDSENPNILNSIGYILADENIDIARALTYCKKAVNLDPNNSSYLDSLGWAYYKAGKKMEARRYLKKAIGIASGNKTIVAHLKAMMKTGKGR